MIIPENLFQLPKKFVSVNIPFCQQNESLSKKFLEKFHKFTNDKFTLLIKWQTKKVRNLFRVKSKNLHPSCKIYFGECSCGETYVGETVRNVEVRWAEHNSSKGKSEPSKHLQINNDHAFVWRIISSAPKNSRERKNLEASIIAIKRPSLNNQIETKTLQLFRNGIT